MLVSKRYFDKDSQEDYELLIGDVVVNNLGGPPMRVISIDAHDGALCKWQDRRGTPHTEWYTAGEIYAIPEQDWLCYR